LQIKAIEKEIDLGQIEEVIAMAKDERELVDYYFGTPFALSVLVHSFASTSVCEKCW
jgi:hypothetical protein